MKKKIIALAIFASGTIILFVFAIASHASKSAVTVGAKKQTTVENIVQSQTISKTVENSQTVQTQNSTTEAKSETTSTWWKPALKTSWQIQFAGKFDPSVNADVFDVDGFDTDAKTVAALHAKGKKVVCYFSAGSVENWRPDFKKFPKAVIGKKLSGWAGENWLDIRNLDVLGPIMSARMDLCKQKGFDGVDFDNVDGFTNPTGFPLSGNDQLKYNRFLAEAAHARGLAVGLKNDLLQAAELSKVFDFEINEQCFAYNECDMLKPFIQAGKPVFNIEYVKNKNTCAKANALNFNTIIKKENLNAWRQTCR